MTFEELNGLIIEWAINRNLLHKDNSKNQYIKATEELAEVGKALLKNDGPGLIDGIGDTFVTLIILAEQNGLNPVECLESAYNEIKNRTGKTLNGTFIKDDPKINEAMQKSYNEGKCKFLYKDQNGNVIDINEDNYDKDGKLTTFNVKSFKGNIDGKELIDQIFKNESIPVKFEYKLNGRKIECANLTTSQAIDMIIESKGEGIEDIINSVKVKV